MSAINRFSQLPKNKSNYNTMKTLIAHKRPFQQNLEEVHLDNVTSWVSQCATEKCQVNSGLTEVQCWNSRSLCALKYSIEWQKGTNIAALHHSGINLAIDPLTRDFWSASGKVTTQIWWDGPSSVLKEDGGSFTIYTAAYCKREQQAWTDGTGFH